MMNGPGLEQHTNNSNARCLVCNKDMRKNHLQRHMKIHQKPTNSSNASCLVCNKEMRKDHLQRHMKIHQKPCRTCDKIYRSTQERNIHEKKCKPCRICKKVYTSIKERNVHENRHYCARKDSSTSYILNNCHPEKTVPELDYGSD